MRRIGIFALTSIVLLGGCHWLDNKHACPPIGNVTRVIITRGMSQDHIFIDPAKVRPLIAFANARRESSKPWDTIPAPQITASFYNDETYVCAIAAGPNFFFVSCPEWKGLRRASGAELDQFKTLTGEIDQPLRPS